MDLAAKTSRLVSGSSREQVRKVDALLLSAYCALAHQLLGKVVAVQPLGEG